MRYQQSEPGSAGIMQELALELSAARSPDDVCEVVCRYAGGAVGASEGAAWFRDGNGRTRLGATTGAVPAELLPLPDLAGFAQTAAAGTGAVTLWMTPALSHALRLGGVGRVRSATLSAGGEVIGAVALVAPTHGEEDLHALAAIVRSAGDALARACAVSQSLDLAAIVHASADAMLRCASDGTVLAWNPAAEKLLGETTPHLGGCDVGQLASGTMASPEWLAARDRVLAGKEAERLVLPHRRADGQLRWMTHTLCRIDDRDATGTGFAVIARDITVELSAQDRVRRLAATVDASPNSVLVADPRGVVLECSPAVERIVSRSREQIIGGSLIDLTENRNELLALFTRALEGSVPAPVTLTRTMADGARAHLQVTAVPVVNDAGHVSAVAIVGVDVTETATMAEALQSARSLEALGRLAGGIAHDFNNLLAIIDAALRDVDASLTQEIDRTALDDALAATVRGARLTRQLLTYARRQPLAAAWVDVHSVLTGLAGVLRTLVGSAVELDLVVPATLPSIRADVAGLEQIILNLVLNAGDAMPSGGRVTVAAEDRGDAIVLTVADTGTGMSEEVQRRIFQPFFTTKTGNSTSGTGLGLAAVHGAVTQIGGTISVQSAPGHGTCFTVRLPVDAHAPAPTPADAPEPATPPLGSGEKILVCDDEPALLRLLTRILEEAGYQVEGHADPREALEAGCDGVDLLLTDLQMPHVSGADLAERMPAGTPVVVMSGYAPDGFDGRDWVLLDKPFSPDELIEAVAYALAQRIR